MPANSTATFIIGLFFGILIGAFLVFLVTTEDTAEPIDAPRPAGRRPEPEAAPPGGGDPHGGDQGQNVAPYHFMKHFLDALVAKPGNHFPAPGYEPLLKDPNDRITLAEFSGHEGLDFERMLDAYPVPEILAQYRRAKNRAMIPLMQRFVGMLNERFGDRLKHAVSCTDCHFLDPSDVEAQIRVFPPLMARFVKALTQEPENRSPASNWKPLLKDPEAAGVRCATCHPSTGARMEQSLGEWDLSRPPEADNKEFMVHLMEAWVSKLNRNARGLLSKAVVCLDCHETDPRR